MLEFVTELAKSSRGFLILYIVMTASISSLSLRAISPYKTLISLVRILLITTNTQTI